MSDRTDSQDLPITELLNEWASGNRALGDRLFALVYDQLHQIAAAHLRREPRDAILQTTGIVHEAYLRLARQPGLEWRSREHFFAFASRVMRRLLVDYARHRGRVKRGSEAIHIALNDQAPGEAVSAPTEILAVHEALQALEAIDADRAHVVELRYFGGLSVAETAAALEVSESTVHRQWRVARAWLFDALRERPDAAAGK